MVEYAETVVHRPEIPELPKIRDGKVRSIFNFAPGRLLMVASDRISARDKVLKPGIPGKGVVLNTMSTFFFTQTRHLAPNHYMTEEELTFRQQQRLQELYHAYPWLVGRAMVVRTGAVVPIEYIFRVRIAGFFYKEYTQAGGPENGARVLGYDCPAGMKDGDQFPETIFTPSTKAPQGEHDENLTYDEAIAYILEKTDLNETKARRVLNWGSVRGIEVVRWAVKYVKARGFVLADTKMEVLLLDDGTELICDELLTPDSSRFFKLDEYERGVIANFDKEPVRQELDKMWNGRGTPPRLPRDVVEATSNRYQIIHDALVD
ncbi:MAG: hypothetical protein A2Z11_02975 [Candidatus Woykebacteria bacterium RBG_16_43_9]|uniref:Phosphoribosylaminoimidazole-succinocarboxamide synthase n=1 Tax=Candidatus Woykebacteria bacterium RBG_16_43_9 TaxID=1802596 RepID=A0A1G1WC77_9BACT|nr:MAG: hypothetical protein A2Z11_02975 [Candidatus Woykebacteria bacterium RBG_16_43_9]